ncbi:MAG: calcium-binding protein [Rhizobiaceae bacterium]
MSPFETQMLRQNNISNLVSINLTAENLTFIGGDGNDTLVGADGNDTLLGGAGNDILDGRGSNDTLNGDEGNDFLIGGAGGDELNGGSGFDTAYYGNSSAVTVNLTTGTGTGGEAQGDTFSGIQIVRGSNFNDVLTGDALANALIGQGGNDVLEGMAAGDALLGGAGSDTASYLSSPDTVAVNIGNGAGAGAHAAGDVLVGIENLTGSQFGDLLRGGSATANNPITDNVLSGFGGGDLILGDEGNDTLFGGAGGDVMTGGAGNDSFLFDNASSEQDIILDFDQNGNDTLIFTGFGPGLNFADFTISNVNDMTNDGIDNGDAYLIASGWQGGVVLKDAFTLVEAGDFVFV